MAPLRDATGTDAHGVARRLGGANLGVHILGLAVHVGRRARQLEAHGSNRSGIELNTNTTVLPGLVGCGAALALLPPGVGDALAMVWISVALFPTTEAAGLGHLLQLSKLHGGRHLVFWVQSFKFEESIAPSCIVCAKLRGSIGDAPNKVSCGEPSQSHANGSPMIAWCASESCPL